MLLIKHVWHGLSYRAPFNPVIMYGEFRTYADFLRMKEFEEKKHNCKIVGTILSESEVK